ELWTRPADTVSRGVLIEQGFKGVPGEIATPASPAGGLLNPMPRSPEVPAAARPWTLPETSGSAATSTSFPLSWRYVLVSIWLLGSVLWLALAGYRVHRFHRLLRFTERAPENLQRRVRGLAARLGLARCPGVRVVAAPISPLLWALVGE